MRQTTMTQRALRLPLVGFLLCAAGLSFLFISWRRFNVGSDPWSNRSGYEIRISVQPPKDLTGGTSRAGRSSAGRQTVRDDLVYRPAAVPRSGQQYGTSSFGLSISHTAQSRLAASAFSSLAAPGPPRTPWRDQILDDEAHKRPEAFSSKRVDLRSRVPKARAAKPAGEWNRLEIRCLGPQVVIKLNGTAEILTADLDSFKTKIGKAPTPRAATTRKGWVGMRSHGSKVDFRRSDSRAGHTDPGVNHPWDCLFLHFPQVYNLLRVYAEKDETRYSYQ